MLICLKCEIEVPAESTACPQCGGPLEDVDESEFEYVEEEGAAPGQSPAAPAPAEAVPPPAPEPAPSLAEAAMPPAEGPGQGGFEPAPQEPGILAPPPDAGTAAPAPPAEGAAAPIGAAGPPPEGAPGAGASPGAEGAPKEKKDRRRTSRVDLKGQTKRTKEAKEGKPEEPAKPPKPPKSVRLDQRRLPVLVGALITLFLSLYLIGDFGLSLMFDAGFHPFQIGMGLWGLMAFLFLLGHGRLGRGAAFILGIAGIAGGIVFMVRFHLENYIFIAGMAVYLLACIVTMTGKGWFLRSAAGLLLFPVVLALCLASLVLDLLPSQIYNGDNAALKKYDETRRTIPGDPAVLAEARKVLEDRMAEDQKTLVWAEKVPWKSLAGFESQVYGLVGRKRLMKLHNTPGQINQCIFESSPEGLERKGETAEELELKGTDNVVLAERGVPLRTLEVVAPNGETAQQGLDIQTENRGRMGQAFIRRMESSERVPDGAKVKASYHYFNAARYALLDEAAKHYDRVVDILGEGATIDLLGEVILKYYGETAGKRRVPNSVGEDLFRRLLKTRLLRLDFLTWKTYATMQELLAAEPRDQARIDETASTAQELAAEYERIQTLRDWMAKNMDGDEKGDRFARGLVGDDEFNMIFFNYTCLLSILQDAVADQASQDSKDKLEAALKKLFTGMKAMTLEDEPNYDQLRQRIGARMANLVSEFQRMRWEDVIKLLARLTDKERALIKEDVAKDVPPEQPWTGPHQNTMGIPYFKLTLPGNDWAGKDLSFEFQLVDGTGILSTRKKPTIRSPKLQHEGFNLELYCPEAPEKGLRYILSECSLRSDDDKVLKEFKSPGKADFDVKAENFVTIVWESFDSLDERSAEMTKVVVVIRVLEIE